VARIGSSRSRALALVAVVLTGCGQSVSPTGSFAVAPTATLDSIATAEQPSPTGPDLVVDGSEPISVGFWTSQVGLIAGRGPRGRPAVARTTDGRRTLTWVDLETDALHDLSVFGTSDAVVLSGCAVEPAVDCEPNSSRTSDGGATWKTVGSGQQLAGLQRVTFAGGIGWGFANLPPGDLQPDPNARALRRSLDGGQTWKTVADPCPATWPSLVGVRFVDARNGWIVCSSEGSGTMEPTAIYVTTDGGRSFAIRSSSDFFGPATLGQAPSGPVGAIEAADLTTAFVMEGRSGTERTDDGGVHWTTTLPGNPEIVFVDTMSATADGSVFAIAVDGDLRQIVLEASSDGGRTWEMRSAWPMG